MGLFIFSFKIHNDFTLLLFESFFFNFGPLADSSFSYVFFFKSCQIKGILLKTRGLEAQMPTKISVSPSGSFLFNEVHQGFRLQIRQEGIFL